MRLKFRGNRLFTAKQLKSPNPGNSQAMKMLLGEERIAKVLDKKQERDELYRALKEEASGGCVTKPEIQKVLGDFRMGRGKSIDRKEAAELAKGIFPSSSLGSPYIYRREKKKEKKPSFTGKALREEKKGKTGEEIERFHTRYGDIERIKQAKPFEPNQAAPPKSMTRLTGN